MNNNNNNNNNNNATEFNHKLTKSLYADKKEGSKHRTVPCLLSSNSTLFLINEIKLICSVKKSPVTSHDMWSIHALSAKLTTTHINSWPCQVYNPNIHSTLLLYYRLRLSWNNYANWVRRDFVPYVSLKTASADKRKTHQWVMLHVSVQKLDA